MTLVTSVVRKQDTVPARVFQKVLKNLCLMILFNTKYPNISASVSFLTTLTTRLISVAELKTSCLVIFLLSHYLVVFAVYMIRKAVRVSPLYFTFIS